MQLGPETPASDSGIYLEEKNPALAPNVKATVTQPDDKPDAMRHEPQDRKPHGRRKQRRTDKNTGQSDWPPALPESLWMKVFDSVKAADSAKASALDVPGLSSHKVQQMVWCLAEARREQERLFLSKNAGHLSIGLMHDGRGRHVAVRYRAVNDQLEDRCGLLALTSCPGGAKELADGIRKAIDIFFTRGAGALNDVRGVKDEASAFQFSRSVQAQCADGAAYAQLACRELDTVFPGLIAIVRDRGHAVINTMKHATEADEVLRAFKEKFVSGPMSVAKELTHCQAFRTSFELARKAQEETEKRPDRKMPLMLSLQQLVRAPSLFEY